MQKIAGYMRKAITQYNMLEDGDTVAVGVSGGKDSVALLTGLAMLRSYIGIDYKLVALTLDPGFGGQRTDYTPIRDLCDQYQIPYFVKDTNIGEIIFDIRKESNPCSLCARMRRGALHDLAVANGCNKIALGHHFDDVIETFFMNLFEEGRIGCFSPVTYLSRKDITLIRPLVFAPEKEIRQAVKKAGLPIVKSKCPADGATNREKTKLFLVEKEKASKDFKVKIFGAIKRAHVDGF